MQMIRITPSSIYNMVPTSGPHDDEQRCRNAMSILNQPPCVPSGRDLDLFCKRQWTANHIEAFAVNVMMSPDLRVILDPVARASYYSP